MKNGLFILLLMLPAVLQAQQERITSLETAAIRYATVDRAGYLYVLTAEGVTKYTPDGDSLQSYPAPGITLFDTGNGVRLLVYNRKEQQYSILSPSLSAVTSGRMDPSFAIEPWLICSSGDYNILIVDAADWSLKKVDVRISKVLTDFKIDTAQVPQPDLVFMREYQNFIFLLDRQAGIMVYNSIGQHLQTIGVTELEYFNFLGEELYYYKDGNISFVDLFTGEVRTQAPGLSARHIVLTDERLYAVNHRSVEIFVYNPAGTIRGKN